MERFSPICRFEDYGIFTKGIMKYRENYDWAFLGKVQKGRLLMKLFLVYSIGKVLFIRCS